MVGCIAIPKIKHMVAFFDQRISKLAHGGKKSGHLLYMVHGIIGFLPDFHDRAANIPTVMGQSPPRFGTG